MFESFKFSKEKIPLKTAGLFALMTFMQSCGHMDKKEIAQAVQENPSAAHLEKSDLQKLMSLVNSAKDGSFTKEKNIGGGTFKERKDGTVVEISYESESFIKDAVNQYKKGADLLNTLSDGGVEFNIRKSDGTYIKKDRLHLDKEGNIYFQEEDVVNKTMQYAEVDPASGFIIIAEEKSSDNRPLNTYKLGGHSTDPSLGGRLSSELVEFVNAVDGLK